MNFIELFQATLTALGGLAAILLVVLGFGWAMFKLFAQKWLESRFTRQEALFAHQHARELQDLGGKLNAKLDRTIKLHQYEFEVLPEIWRKANEAFGYAASFVSPLQTSPDIDSMGNLQFEEFLSESELREWQKEELRDSSDKNVLYPKLIFWHRHNKVIKAYNEFYNYLVTKGIFIRPIIKSELRSLSDILNDAIMEREFIEQGISTYAEGRDKTRRIGSEGKALLKQIEDIITARVWDGIETEAVPVALSATDDA